MARLTPGDFAPFLAVAHHLSFRAAARSLGVSPSALSHAMRALEGRLGARLLNSTSRSVALTEQGLRLLERLRPAMEVIDEAVAELREGEAVLSGRIRINAMEAGALALLDAAVVRFARDHPAVEVEITTDAALVDIVAGGFDAGVRLREAVPRAMVAVPIGPPASFAVVAAPAYLAEHPPPTSPADLAAHRCVRLRFPSGALMRWEFEHKGRAIAVSPAGNLTVCSLAVAVEAAAQGAGLAWVPLDQAADAIARGRRVRLVADWSPEFDGLCLYYPPHRVRPRAFAVFVAEVRKHRPHASGRADAQA